jgi:hypothetical protein
MFVGGKSSSRWSKPGNQKSKIKIRRLLRLRRFHEGYSTFAQQLSRCDTGTHSPVGGQNLRNLWIFSIFVSGRLGSMVKYVRLFALDPKPEPVECEVENGGGIKS